KDPGITGKAVQNIPANPQPWTRFAALCLVLASGHEYLDIHAVAKIFDELPKCRGTSWNQFEGGNWPSEEARGLERRAFLTAAERLLDERPGEETTRLLERILTEYPFTMGLSRSFDQLLLRKNCGGILEKANDARALRVPKIDPGWFSSPRLLDADRAVLE